MIIPGSEASYSNIFYKSSARACGPEKRKDRIVTQKQSHFDSHLHGVLEEAIWKHLYTQHNNTAVSNSINREKDMKNRVVGHKNNLFLMSAISEVQKSNNFDR
jgi:hypothetical protein